MLRKLIIAAVFGLLSCAAKNQVFAELGQDIQLDEEKIRAKSERLIITKISKEDETGFTEFSTRLELHHHGKILQSYQEAGIIFLYAQKVVIGEDQAYFITCERHQSSWGATKSIIVWSDNGPWSITPLHFHRASLHKHKNRFLIDERMSNKSEEKSKEDLYEFKNGLLYKYKK